MCPILLQLGPFSSYLGIDEIYLYNIGNEFKFVYFVKILQTKITVGEIVLPLESYCFLFLMAALIYPHIFTNMFAFYNSRCA